MGVRLAPAKAAKIGVIGLGKMGRCLVQGMVASGIPAESISYTTRKGVAAIPIPGLDRCENNKALVAKVQTIVVAVKPQNMEEVLKEIGSKLSREQTLISIVAAVETKDIESKIAKSVPVIRAMPNTPAQVRTAMTAICRGKSAAEADVARAGQVFSAVGRVVEVDEKQMEAVTGLSGCGPAYTFVVLEALSDAGIKLGLSRDLSIELAAQTVLGAAKMLLETKAHPAALKDEVTTPAGCTIDGLLELEEGKLRVTLVKAVVRAAERARVLGRPERG